MQVKSSGHRLAGLVSTGFLLGAALVLGGFGDSRSLAQEAVPGASRPVTPEMREIELLRREVADLKELVRKLQENIASRDGGHVRPAVDLTWPEALKVPAPQHEILEEPRGHLLFPIQIERANFPHRSPLQRLNDATPQNGIRPIPEPDKP
jgi:hypothetical protein